MYFIHTFVITRIKTVTEFLFVCFICEHACKLIFKKRNEKNQTIPYLFIFLQMLVIILKTFRVHFLTFNQKVKLWRTFSHDGLDLPTKIYF